MTSPVTVCACGRSVWCKDKCRPCYSREWREAKKAAGGRRADGYRIPGADDWYDWAIVERAWVGDPLPRKLTHAERCELAYRAVVTGLIRNSNILRDVLRMPHAAAVKLAESVASGEVRVMGRTPLGAPTQWLPAPIRP